MAPFVMTITGLKKVFDNIRVSTMDTRKHTT